MILSLVAEPPRRKPRPLDSLFSRRFLDPTPAKENFLDLDEYYAPARLMFRWLLEEGTRPQPPRPD
jgi:hypothetical protein